MRLHKGGAAGVASMADLESGAPGPVLAPTPPHHCKGHHLATLMGLFLQHA